MRSTFSGFNAAKSGLFAAQRALDITGHNISNVNTKGYTRQRLEQSQSTPMKLPGGQGMLGTGVDTTAIHQLRNEFLDYKYRDESSTLGYWAGKSDGLSFIEAIMNEPSDTGISTVIDEFFESLEELSKAPENLTTRALVRQRGITFSNTVNHMYTQLEKMAIDTNYDINAMVKSINTYGEQIARLNDQILRSEVDGSNANDLRDQRNLLIDRLSEIVDVEVLEITNPDSPKHKKMVIKIAGKPLVYHSDFTGLEVGTKKHEFFEGMQKKIDVYDIKWADGTEFNDKNISGELKALLNPRDGTGVGGEDKGIPYYISQLNEFVNVFANEINALHLTGYGLNKNEERKFGFFTVDGAETDGAIINRGLKDPLDAGSEGIFDKDGNLFAGTSDIFKNLNASNIRISLDLEDLNNIAASKEKDLLPKDGSIMLDIIGLRHKSGMFNEGKPEDFIKSLIGTLGVEAEEADRNALNQLILVDGVENRRQSISGVHQDEELANMVKFQHAYNASARMITTIDEMLDVLINRVGIVGR